MTVKGKLVASEHKWWLCLIRFLKLLYTLWKVNGNVCFQYTPNFFGNDGTRRILPKLLFVFYISSNEYLKLSMVLFIPKSKRNASFPTCSKSASGKKNELTGIKIAYK